MRHRTGLRWVALALLAAGAPIAAQTLNNQSLSGKFFFRHVSLGTDGSGNLTDPRSLIGTITFDGSGHYSYTGQQVVGTGAASTQSGSGAYSVDPAGFVSLDSPLRSGAEVNARLGSSVLLGSTTESTDNTFDLFAAILAPTPAAPVGSTLAGPFWAVTLEFPGASQANVRDNFFGLSSSVAGQFAAISVNGHAANLGGGLPAAQQVTGATYTMGPDGTGSATFGPASTAALLSGARTLYLSADGNMLLGGSTAAGSHDFFLAVKAGANVSNTTWTAPSAFWGAGLRSDSSGPWGYAGAVSARGLGFLTWTRRYKHLGNGAYDYTGLQTYALKSDGSGTVLAAGAGLGPVGLGAGSKAFVGAILNSTDVGGYEIFFGVQMNAVTGTGVFLNPQGVLNAASYAPAGNPIAPGEYVSLFGSGMAASQKSAGLPPYPFTLNGVTVLVNGKPAPLYYVSGTQIDALIPYATQGPTATVVVQNGSVSSNTVTVPVAATAPGFFSADETGTGIAAVNHQDPTRGTVTPANPASPGETVSVFLSGMGGVSPALADGTATGLNPLSSITASPIAIYIAGQAATLSYSGLAPNYPGLYQINVTVPLAIFSSANVPMAMETPNAFHDQVSLAVQ